MGPRCSSAETHICHRSYIIAAHSLSDLVVLKNSKYRFRYYNIAEMHRVRITTCGKSAFKYTTAVLWNDLPDDLRKIDNFNQFKNILQSWNGNACKCNTCKQF